LRWIFKQSKAALRVRAIGPAHVHKRQEPQDQLCNSGGVSLHKITVVAGLFEQAVALDPKAEEGYFAYARYLDQHMRDARERQERARAARAEAQARAKDGGATALHYDMSRDDRLGGRSK
jgi:uncharacterized protein with GYD domain